MWPFQRRPVGCQHLITIPPTRCAGRHWYAVITGFLLIYYPFGNGCFNAFVTALLSYGCMLRFRQHCGTLVWLIAFPYLIANHILQASGMAWKEGHLDFTGAQMILTLKLVSVAMCYQDGARSDDTSLRSYARAKALQRCPSLLEYFSYLFAAGNLLSGPTFEAKDYFDYTSRRGDWAVDARGRLPNPAVPGTYRFIKAMACAVVWVYFTKQGYNVELLESTYWREETSMVMRLALLWATIVVYRFKYYCVWGVSESALIFSGFGFSKYDENVRQHSHAVDALPMPAVYHGRRLFLLSTNGHLHFRSRLQGKAVWDRYISSHIRLVELNPSLADTPRHWNIQTGVWLRHCE